MSGVIRAAGRQLQWRGQHCQENTSSGECSERLWREITSESRAEAAVVMCSHLLPFGSSRRERGVTGNWRARVRWMALSKSSRVECDGQRSRTEPSEGEGEKVESEKRQAKRRRGLTSIRLNAKPVFTRV